MTDRVVLITGATRGIGKATAHALAKLGDTVVVSGRDPALTAATVAEIRAASGNEAVSGMVADLASQVAVRGLVAEVREKLPRLDVLINNAGGIFDRQVTVDGLEQTFAVDHLAPFILTNGLLDLLKASAPARVITVSSVAHMGGAINFDDLQGERKYRAMDAYAQAKLANILFAKELARRLEGSGVTSNAVHPGAVATGFGREGPRWMRLGVKLVKPFEMSPEKSARQLVWLATAPELATTTGQYFSGGKVKPGSQKSRDMDVAARLWEVSEALVATPAG
ncbi:MAG: SDR family oxidoreductase [Dehalococcoidia bacterium]